MDMPYHYSNTNPAVAAAALRRIIDTSTISTVHLVIWLDLPHMLQLLIMDNDNNNNNHHRSSSSSSCGWMEVVDERHRTPFLLACQLGRYGCVQVILSSCSSSRKKKLYLAKDSILGNTALHYCCCCSGKAAAASTLKLLLLHAASSTGTTSSQQHCYRRLLCRPNNSGETPLHLACVASHGGVDLVECLLAHSPPQQQRAAGRSACWTAMGAAR